MAYVQGFDPEWLAAGEFEDEKEDGMEQDGSLLSEDGKQAVVRLFEEACDMVALVFGDSPQREVAIRARGRMRQVNGEAVT